MSATARSEIFGELTNVPQMMRFGYTPRFAVGCVAGSSILGMLIPPSLLLIIYGVLAEVSIGGLFLLNDNLFRSMAIGTIAVVLIAVIGSLTFLPATLAILGDNIDRLRVPFLGRDRPEGSGVWAVVVRAVMRHPVVTFLVSAAILIAIASPTARLHMGQSDFASFPDKIDGVQAINLLNEKWPEG